MHRKMCVKINRELNSLLILYYVPLLAQFLLPSRCKPSIFKMNVWMIDLNGHKGKNGEEEKLSIYILYLSISEFFNWAFVTLIMKKRKTLKW